MIDIGKNSFMCNLKFMGKSAFKAEADELF